MVDLLQFLLCGLVFVGFLFGFFWGWSFAALLGIFGRLDNWLDNWFAPFISLPQFLEFDLQISLIEIHRDLFVAVGDIGVTR